MFGQQLLRELDEWSTQSFRRPSWDDPGLRTTNGTPPVNVYEDTDHVYLEAHVPGLNADEVTISVTDHTLRLQGERKGEREKDHANYHIREARYGSFERSFRFPNDVNPGDATATYERGVLAVKVPKLERAKPKLIPVEVKA